MNSAERVSSALSFAFLDLSSESLSAPRSQRYSCERECEFWRAPKIRLRIFATKSQTKSCKWSVAKEFASECKWFCERNCENSSSLRRVLANGSLRHNSLAIANAMALCTQVRAWCPTALCLTHRLHHASQL